MQKKQVKIMGFQAENCKLKLFYETNGEENNRYIVEKNRKYVKVNNNYYKTVNAFLSEVMNEINQLKLNI